MLCFAFYVIVSRKYHFILKNMSKKILSLVLILFIILGHISLVRAWEERANTFNVLRSIDLWTFNEYWYRLTSLYFKLREKFEVNNVIDSKISKDIEKLANTSYNYLPDSLNNKKLLDTLKIALQKWDKYKNSEAIYWEIVKAMEKYLYDSEINKITWTIEALPSSWNAPLNTTLRARITNPSWTKIPSYNYVWWIDEAWKRKIVGRGVSINYTLNEEWKFSIFLDVLSDHRNSKWYIDVLPFSSRADIDVKQKIANVIIKIQDKNLRNEDTIKFSPEEASFWLIFDATSSTPTSWTKFLKTSWDFWNWVKREYDGTPKIERVTYWKEGEYKVILKLKTNELQEVERKFTISIHKPIASIESNLEQWYMWDRFIFTANAGSFEKNLSYNWDIVDIDKNTSILKKSGNVFNYEFTKKWKFNIKLKVTSPSWEVDNDNKIIYINSRAPTADFWYSIPKTNKPNRVLLDWTKSFDQDYTDEWKLEYSWEIDWQKVDLENPNYNWWYGYYTFDSVWDHTILLEVTDPDGIKSQKKNKISINSVLSVDFTVNPMVIQRNSFIRFISESPEARIFKWNFWDWKTSLWSQDKISHYFDKSWTFNINLEVTDSEWNINNITKTVYVWESNYPYWVIWVTYDNGFDVPFDSAACNWKWAYVADRVNPIKFSWQDSINIDWQQNWLIYSWKIWQDKLASTSSISQRIEELWCFPIKLIVKSEKNWKTHTRESLIEIKNLKPQLVSLNVQPVDINWDPVIVNLDAVWAKDKDGVIQSYTWYYYTDSDSESQDYRSTIRPSTTFVLPKIAWTYYFVLLMKDNNEEKFLTADLGSKYFLTISWDNSNTPLVELWVDDSSITVDEEVTFNAKVRNIITQDLTSKSTYSWDFDWDWFYDKEITWKWITTYKFSKAGTYHVKVKAKYKWISSVKTITINVVNELTPDFDYIAIWNKIVFFNKSMWKYDSITWDLWDWNTKELYANPVYVYSDWKQSHEVKLKITDWTKLKEVSKTVSSNTKNLIKFSKIGVNIISNQEISDDWKITLKEEKEKVFIYLGASKWEYRKFAIDYDIMYDSNLNWWKDDDEDNKDTTSYSTWDPVEIKLSENKKQTLRVLLKDIKWKILVQKDIEIIKEFIKVEPVVTKDIIFKWVTDNEKKKIDLLKWYISRLPQNYISSWMKYLERLQSDWFDLAEKTKIILEFENFLDNPEIKNSSEIIDLLESILVEWQADKSQKNVAFSALKNLLRDDIVCTFDSKSFKSCKLYLVSILEDIKNSSDLTKNKELAKNLLQAIFVDKNMTDKEKTDFKEVLKILVNDPNQQIEAPIPTETWIISKIFSFIKSIAWIIFSIVAVVFLVVIWYWFYFKFSNKDKTKWFEEFIIEKTATENDILNELWWNNEWSLDSLPIIDRPENQESKWNVIQSNNIWEVHWELYKQVSENEIKINNWKIVDNNQQTIDDDISKVPDWLKWTFEKNENNQISEVEKTVVLNDVLENNEQIETTLEVSDPLFTNKEELSEKDNNVLPEKVNNVDLSVPDWLKWTFDTPKTDSVDSEIKSDFTKENLSSEIHPLQNEENIQNEFPNNEIVQTSKLSNEDSLSVPDWLKWSLEEWEKKKEEKITPQEEINKEKQVKVKTKKEDFSLDEVTKIEENPIPDWLKWSLDGWENKNEDPLKKEEKKIESKPKQKKERNATINLDNINILASDNEELWQDGMKVPDWLSDAAKDDNSSKKV